jgi:hypothetical protein
MNMMQTIFQNVEQSLDKLQVDVNGFLGGLKSLEEQVASLQYGGKNIRPTIPLIDEEIVYGQITRLAWAAY